MQIDLLHRWRDEEFLENFFLVHGRRRRIQLPGNTTKVSRLVRHHVHE